MKRALRPIGRVAGAVAIVTGLMLTSPANARRIVIDSGESIGNVPYIAGCTLGSAEACAPQSLPFFLDLDGSLTNEIYIYDSGLISIGSAISPAVDPLSSDLTSFGANVLAPFFVPGSTSSVLASPIIDFMIGGEFPFFDMPETGFVIKFQHAPAPEFPSLDNEIVVLLSASNGNLNAEYIYGFQLHVFNGEDEIGFLFSSSFDLDGANIGYNVGNGTLQFTPTSQSDLEGFDFRNLQLAGNAVPEPSTWLTLIVGFGLAGVMARWRGRPRLALA